MSTKVPSIKDKGLRMYISSKVKKYGEKNVAMASRMTLGIHSLKNGFDDQLAIMLNRLRGSVIARFREATSKNLERLTARR